MRQIAGRAGRFGIYDNGYVNIMEDDERFHIAHMLATDDTSDLQKLPIAANMGQIEAISNQLHTAKISECLEYFANRLQFNHALFALSKVAAQLNQALLVDQFAPKLSLKDKFIFTCAPIAINVSIEKDYFLLCLKSVVEHIIRTLPPAPIWLDSNNPKHLESAEILSQNISLYAWLSYKFPQIFVDAGQVAHLRQAVSRYIERALLTQTGYGDTQRESDLLKHISR